MCIRGRLDDRLAEVRAQELGDVLGRELEPGVVVARGSGELFDELRAGALTHDLPGLVDHDELRAEVGPDRVPEDAERRELGDVTDLWVADRREADDEKPRVRWQAALAGEDRGERARRPALEPLRERLSAANIAEMADEIGHLGD